MSEISLVFSDLSSSDDLLGPVPLQHACSQITRKRANTYLRYEVAILIIEGTTRPKKDVDNYAKRVLDIVTGTGLLWRDDEQIDTLSVDRRRDWSRKTTEIRVDIKPVPGQHSSSPTFFRALCTQARSGTSTYEECGFHLALNICRQPPYSIDPEEWERRVDVVLISLLEENDDENTILWFFDHYPGCMRLIPKARIPMFLRGVRRAYDEDRICG